MATKQSTPVKGKATELDDGRGLCSNQSSTPRVLRAAMLGGGASSFIGEVHRHALRLDGKYELVAGVFSRDGARSAAFGASLGLPRERVYGDIDALLAGEAARPVDERIEIVIVVTPTPAHAEAVKKAAAAGLAVICDKPLASSLEEAKEVIAALSVAKSPCMLIHNYSGFPMIKQARHLVESGRLGDILKVVIHYEQGWLLAPDALSSTGSITTLADVGSHAAQLLTFVTGRSICRVMADCATIAPSGGARSPDDCNMLLRLDGGVRGVMIASQATAGKNNGFHLSVYGSRGGLFWHQEMPESLEFSATDAPRVTFVRGGPGLCGSAVAASRIPVGHPEGFIEAFANLYRNFHATVTEGAPPDFPSAEDGAAGLAFVEAALKSSDEERWVDIPSPA